MNYPQCPLSQSSPVVAYARVSPGPGQDITSQVNYLTGYAQFYQLNLLRIFQDRARSGGTMAGREGLADMVKFLLDPPGSQAPVVGVLFYDTSRLSRDMNDAQQARNLLRQHGYVLVFIHDNIPAGPEGIFLEAAHDYLAEKFRADLRDLVRRGHLDVVKMRGPDGKYLSFYAGRLPFGFLTERINTGLAKNNGDPRILTRLTGPDPALAPQILAAYQLRAAGLSFRQIEDEVKLFGWPVLADSNQEIQTKFFNRYKYLFRLSIYKGVYEYREKVWLAGRHGAPDGIKIQTTRQKNPIFPGWIVRHYYEQPVKLEDFVEPIVPADLWDAVQRVRNSTRRPRSGTAKNHTLTGLVYCGHCQAAMYAHSRTTNGKYTYTYLLYRCPNAARFGSCGFGEVRAEPVDEAVFEAVCGYLHSAAIDDLTRRVNEILADIPSRNQQDQAEIKQLENERRNLLNLVKRADREAEAEYIKLGDELEAARSRLSAIASISPLHFDREVVERELFAIGSDVKERQRFFKRMIARVELKRGEKVTVTATLRPDGFLCKQGGLVHQTSLSSLIPPLVIEIPVRA